MAEKKVKTEKKKSTYRPSQRKKAKMIFLGLRSRLSIVYSLQAPFTVHASVARPRPNGKGRIFAHSEKEVFPTVEAQKGGIQKYVNKALANGWKLRERKSAPAPFTLDTMPKPE